MEEFEDDLEAVARALVAGPYHALGGRSLNDLVLFDGESHERAVRDARDVPKAFSPRSSDARELVAAARLAYDSDPEGYRDSGVPARMLRRIAEVQTVGIRAGMHSPVDEEIRRARDAAAGRRLADHLTRKHANDV
jgi:hypothetical protein